MMPTNSPAALRNARSEITFSPPNRFESCSTSSTVQLRFVSPHFAEECSLQPVRIAQPCRGIGEPKESRRQHVTARRHAEGRAGILYNQKNADARGRDTPNQFEDLLDEARSQAERGLIEAQQSRINNQRTPKGEHLLLPTRHAYGL